MRAIRRLGDDLVDDAQRGLLGSDDRLFVDGLMASRPEFVERDGSYSRPFTCLADVEEADAWARTCAREWIRSSA